MTPARRAILLAMADMSERYPEMRFGQLVANIASWANGPTAAAVWDVEDDEFLAGIQSHISQPLCRPNPNVVNSVKENANDR